MKFILVDDDDFTNLINDMILKDALGDDVVIKSFEKPEEALELYKKLMPEIQIIPYFFSTSTCPELTARNFWSVMKNLVKQ